MCNAKHRKGNHIWLYLDWEKAKSDRVKKGLKPNL